MLDIAWQTAGPNWLKKSFFYFEINFPKFFKIQRGKKYILYFYQIPVDPTNNNNNNNSDSDSSDSDSDSEEEDSDTSGQSVSQVHSKQDTQIIEHRTRQTENEDIDTKYIH